MVLKQWRSNPARTRRFNWWTVAFVIAACTLGLFLAALVLRGHAWRAVAYAVVALFVFLVALAVHFWGSLLFGGLLDVALQRRAAVPWSLGDEHALQVPEHDIDPGLELFAAGMLVYRLGEVKPSAYFRTVPLAGVRALRPFIVARTGAGRDYPFTFLLRDARDVTQFDEAVMFALHNRPQVVMPPYRLVTERPRILAGQRWTLQVKSGVTVVATFRFLFVDGAVQGNQIDAGRVDAQDRVPAHTAWHLAVLPQLLDEAVKRDAMAETRDVVLEVV